MSAILEDKLEDVYKWYLYNKSNVPPLDLKKRCDFQQKTIDCLFELMAILTQDMQNLEGARRQLYLPRSVSVSGDVREFG